MTDVAAQLAVWLNAVANAVGRFLLAPVAILPGWLSATAVAALSGLLLLWVFKHTSHQRAIKRVRDDISAHLLALKLFQESTSVTFRAQGRILLGALRLLVLAARPMLVMAVPVGLLWGQLALWYQARPLRVGEETVMTLGLCGEPDASWPHVSLRPTNAVEVMGEPVRVLSQREVCWAIRAREEGYHRLVVEVDGQPYGKELAVADGYLRVSAQRPAWRWSDILAHPAEPPFRPGEPVRSIRIDYPTRDSWTSGTDRWVVYWLALSVVAAWCFRPWLKVHL